MKVVLKWGAGNQEAALRIKHAHDLRELGLLIFYTMSLVYHKVDKIVPPQEILLFYAHLITCD